MNDAPSAKTFLKKEGTTLCLQKEAGLRCTYAEVAQR